MSNFSTIKNQIQELIDLANATTGKTDEDLTTALNSLMSGYGSGSDSGGGSATDSLNLMDYVGCIYNMFNNVAFPENTDLVLNIPKFKNADTTSCFYYATGLNSITLSCEAREIKMNANNMFRGCTTVKKIDLSNFNRLFYNAGNCFYGCTALDEIVGELNLTLVNNVDAIFGNCTALSEICFVTGGIVKSLNINNSSLLSDASIQSIIDGLADLTGGTAQTLTLHADVKAKLTDTQIAAITSKNWTLA